MDYDVVIIGGGPSGLATAIKLAQTFKEKNLDKSICVLEKSAEIGGHILSGNCLLYTSPSPRDVSSSRMPSSA